MTRSAHGRTGRVIARGLPRTRPICRECGNDEAAWGWLLCPDCLELLYPTSANDDELSSERDPDLLEDEAEDGLLDTRIAAVDTDAPHAA